MPSDDEEWASSMQKIIASAVGASQGHVDSEPSGAKFNNKDKKGGKTDATSKARKDAAPAASAGRKRRAAAAVEDDDLSGMEDEPSPSPAPKKQARKGEGSRSVQGGAAGGRGAGRAAKSALSDETRLDSEDD
eukprot:CAMPEP_0173403360 /NCGR_PEP_ID=MMETSP1356-20130122/56572_1 /TAXON_ID=77927 ORGANISM="Hemiselmis virescens, Strain PCC157" /NCGR_SAMPLE_ID=MMETSP1356 /ASSEMBLY_ACC=CAM_ASM_000847 /LENGTH=132 /DNA_ID=CAMNT_0014363873 /DNA_START=150 /DNA_END=545 /DNA_ORIENTATION=-